MAVRKPATQPARPSWHELADRLGPQRARRSTARRVAQPSAVCTKCNATGCYENLVVLMTNGTTICQRCRKAKR